jgi:hypothetical protein
MRILASSKLPVKRPIQVIPVQDGGTGASSSQEAVANLGGILANKLDQPGGIAQSGPTNKVQIKNLPEHLVRSVTIKGPKHIPVGQVVEYKITNYDSHVVYSVSATRGSISIIGDTIHYSATQISGPVDITVNDRTITVIVEGARPSTPTVTVKTVGNNIKVTADINGSPFTMTVGNATHSETDWELSTDITFRQVIRSSYADTDNLTAISFTDLGFGQTYYVRARYKDNTNIKSDWSEPTAFTTKLRYVFSNVEAIVTATTDISQSSFGTSVVMSDDGSRMAAVSQGASPDPYVSMYVRKGSAWELESRLQLIPANSAKTPVCLSMDKAGTVVVAGAPFAGTGSNVAGGRVTVFRRIGSIWVREAAINPIRTGANERFGQSVSISEDGNRLVVGCPGIGLTGQGNVYVYTAALLDNSDDGMGNYSAQYQWILQSTLPLPAGASITPIHLFGYSVAMSGDGQTIMVSAPDVTVDGKVKVGTIFQYSLSSNAWTYTGRSLTHSSSLANDNLSIASGALSNVAGMLLSQDGKVLACSIRRSSNGEGRVTVFRFVDNAWIQEGFLEPTGPDSNTSNRNLQLLGMTRDARLILVGTPLSSSSVGNAFLFRKSGATWSQELKLTHGASGSVSTSMSYGFSGALSTDGTRAVIAAPGYSSNTGSLFVFS